MIKIGVSGGDTTDLSEMNNEYIGLVENDEIFNLVFTHNEPNKVQIETLNPDPKGSPKIIGEISRMENPNGFTIKIHGKEDHIFTLYDFIEEIKRALSHPNDLENSSCIAMTLKEAEVLSKLQRVVK